MEQVHPFSLVLLAGAVGLVTGGGAIVFAKMINAVQWVAIRKGRIQHRDDLPDPNEVLTAHDYLVVVGRSESIEQFRNGTSALHDETLASPSS